MLQFSSVRKSLVPQCSKFTALEDGTGSSKDADTLLKLSYTLPGSSTNRRFSSSHLIKGKLENLLSQAFLEF
ncbi:hypothetical protein Tco_0924367 [Tanacetum coccineum]|uniref:Uncharacterized protein n=1 Tax=Tanacetum coccineum TaxID=301880 RepID=A0ABQ5D5U3_9ASTR